MMEKENKNLALIAKKIKPLKFIEENEVDYIS